MAIDRARCRQYLRGARFVPLFIDELGWDRHTGTLQTVVDGQTHVLTAIAQKRGMQVYTCAPLPDGRIPEYPLRRKIEAQVAKSAYEHLIIYSDAQKTLHTWQWARRESGRSAVWREHTYHQGQPGDSLLQKLEYIAFTLDEEADLTLTAVTGRARAAFDVEKLTKRFYDRFKTEHATFMAFLQGIPDEGLQRWYVSVLINRLMFIYFIQKKGFLAGDVGYLPRKLAQSMARGRDRFYRDFLCPLFFEGFARKEEDRSPEIRALLGNIPYLDGGLFQRHQIEEVHGRAIQVPDAAFERLFRFFDEYQWNLDQRPNRPDNEINPDVLGYIFEKYINQKEMGAYYTKEDITGYICRNTMLPFLFDKLENYRYQAVNPLPVRDIEPYIYPAVAQEEHLPTETDREYQARRARLEAIRADFAAGKIGAINDFITCNLDIERFAQDWVRELTDPLTLRAFYFECLTKLTVLDPTVGSGAFLFAAMNILEPLYEACLDKMAQLQDPRYPHFQRELARVAGHPNRRYFILKSIVVNNLYGVDLMEEATEICKLRLFLKLVAQLEPGHPIEPLPDIDFNIRAGNTLVGYATKAEIEGRLFSANIIPKINVAEVRLHGYRELQTGFNIPAAVLASAKAETQQLLQEIDAELNEALRGDYGAPDLTAFVQSHRPFHWYVEFNGIMQGGGFDVIVGNPPYIEYAKLKGQYQLSGYRTLECGNLYAFVLERCFRLLKEGARFGMIVQLSAICTDRMSSLQDEIRSASATLWISGFDDRPGKLFDGLEHIRAAIVLSAISHQPAHAYRSQSTKLLRWYTEARASLFDTLGYADVTGLEITGSIPKAGNSRLMALISKVRSEVETVDRVYEALAENMVYYHRSPLYWIRAMDFLPLFESAGATRSIHHFKDFGVSSSEFIGPVGCIINSSLFYIWFIAYGNGRNVALRDIRTFPCDVRALVTTQGPELNRLFQKLMDDYSAHSKVIQRRDGVKLQEFYPSKSKNVLDEIDLALGKHFGFSDEELDFIVNYDIKYRMGQTESDDEA